jgi:hypothetical protein
MSDFGIELKELNLQPTHWAEIGPLPTMPDKEQG